MVHDRPSLLMHAAVDANSLCWTTGDLNRDPASRNGPQTERTHGITEETTTNLFACSIMLKNGTL